jgi:hypothetical protein
MKSRPLSGRGSEGENLLRLRTWSFRCRSFAPGETPSLSTNKTPAPRPEESLSKDAPHKPRPACGWRMGR